MVKKHKLILFYLSVLFFLFFSVMILPITSEVSNLNNFLTSFLFIMQIVYPIIFLIICIIFNKKFNLKGNFIRNNIYSISIFITTLVMLFTYDIYYFITRNIEGFYGIVSLFLRNSLFSLFFLIIMFTVVSFIAKYRYKWLMFATAFVVLSSNSLLLVFEYYLNINTGTLQLYNILYNFSMSFILVFSLLIVALISFNLFYYKKCFINKEGIIKSIVCFLSSFLVISLISVYLFFYERYIKTNTGHLAVCEKEELLAILTLIGGYIFILIIEKLICKYNKGKVLKLENHMLTLTYSLVENIFLVVYICTKFFVSKHLYSLIYQDIYLLLASVYFATNNCLLVVTYFNNFYEETIKKNGSSLI